MQHSDDEQIDAFDCEYRYDLFLSQVVDKRELWILIDDNDCFLNIHAKEEGLHYLPGCTIYLFGQVKMMLRNTVCKVIKSLPLVCYRYRNF